MKLERRDAAQAALEDGDIETLEELLAQGGACPEKTKMACLPRREVIKRQLSKLCV